MGFRAPPYGSKHSEVAEGYTNSSFNWPGINWAALDFSKEWERFYQHCEFTFGDCSAYAPRRRKCPGGGTPLYNVYRYVPPQRVWFLSRFGLKTGIDFDNYGLKSGRVFGAGNIYESLQTYFSSQNVTGTTNL